MKKIMTSLVLGLVGAFAAPTFAVDYVNVKPIDQVVQKNIRSCRGGEGSLMHTITWGADAVTYYANGNSPTTQPNSFLAQNGVNITLKREDVFTKQIEKYLACETPYIRGTLGQLNLIASLTESDPRTRMVIIQQMSWSNGGDVLVVSEDIKKPADLKGKTIVLQAYGPHIDYLATVLSDAGLSLKDVNLKFVKDLTGDSDSTPYISFFTQDADAAMVIVPDAIRLTSDFSVGSGSDGSRKGAHALLSTKSCSTCINDVIAVRADYLETAEGRKEVQAFVNGWFKAEEAFVKGGKKEKATLRATAKYLLDMPDELGEAEGLIADAETAGYAMNRKFFTDTGWPRNFKNLNNEIRGNYKSFGLTKTAVFKDIGWDYDLLKAGIKNTALASSALNDAQHKAVTKIVTSKAMIGGDDDGSLFTFQVNFAPNSKDVTLDNDIIEKVTQLVAKYGGAVITIEGHADPLGYLKSKKNNPSAKAVHERIKQSALNTSLNRSMAVREIIMKASSANGFEMHPNQFITIGHGFKKPLTGTDRAGEPLAPKSKQAWLSNMRVVFKLVNIEAESSEFELL